MNDNEKKRFMVMLDDLIRSVNEGDREEAVRLRQEIIRTVTPLEKLPEFIVGTERVVKADKQAEVTFAYDIPEQAVDWFTNKTIDELATMLVREYFLHDRRPFQVRIAHRVIVKDWQTRVQVRCEVQDTVWHDLSFRNPADIDFTGDKISGKRSW